MTPFELSLGHELDIERRRFDSEWLFQWYNILSDDRIVNVPSFDGGRIARNGVFEGQAQSLYWQAIGRYLNGKVHETFQRWDRETNTYPAVLRRASLDGTARLLGQFVAGLMERANTTDQALRGHGTPKTDKASEGSGAHSQANVQILRLTQAYQALLPAEIPEVKASGWRQFADALNLKPGFMGMSIDLKKLFSRDKR
jgi:hypothetical protein